jgi:hypothetical protein
MQKLRSKLTYANVIATLALFMAMSGGVVWAAKKIGANQLKANSVGTAKLKKNAVTAKKIKKNAVTKEKIATGAVDFSKLATGTSVVATANGGPVAVSAPSTPLVSIPLTGTTSFTPTAGVVNMLNIEARGVNLARSGINGCGVTVVPYINGKAFMVSSGFLALTADTNTPSETNPVPIDSEAGPVGLGQPGVAQQISAKVVPNPNCSTDSQVAVSFVVTQFK